MTGKQKNSRNIPIKDRMILYSEAAGECSMEGCDENLIFPIYEGKSTLSNIAHIEALNEDGARFNPNLTVKERNSEDNLILVCLGFSSLLILYFLGINYYFLLYFDYYLF